jgi:phosphopantothenoylcysteine decarboxylase / phosphopantothenate---cysteine ligase
MRDLHIERPSVTSDKLHYDPDEVYLKGMSPFESVVVAAQEARFINEQAPPSRSDPLSTPGLSGRRVLLGLTGGIAAYKAPELVRALSTRGAVVRCLATRNALRLVSADTLATLTGHPVETSSWDSGTDRVHHVDWAQWADILVIAPLTANTAAKLAHGLSDDAVSLAWLSCTCPKLVCPAMNTRMLEAPATARNLLQLEQDGATVLAPDSGDLACGETGPGRMPDPERIVEEIERIFSPKADVPRRILVTLGRTEEPIDDVRVLTNRSSGRTGADLVREALNRGHQVTAICGPCEATIPVGARIVRVRTALEMRDAALSAWPDHDWAIAAAAVADFRPAVRAEGKIPASRGMDRLDLVPNPDILSELCASKAGRRIAGFALESGNMDRGTAKLLEKGADIAVCNDPLRDPEQGGFGAGSSWAWVGRAGDKPHPGWISKTDLAARILDALETA